MSINKEKIFAGLGFLVALNTNATPNDSIQNQDESTHNIELTTLQSNDTIPANTITFSDALALRQDLKQTSTEFNFITTQLDTLSQQSSSLTTVSSIEETKLIMKQSALEAHEFLDSLRLSPPEQKIEYALRYTDNAYETTLACFNYTQNSIYQYVNNNDSIKRAYSADDAVLNHEYNHKLYHQSQTKELPMSLKQKYEIEMHDEIQANICEVLTYRQDYINATTPSQREDVLKKCDERKTKFYSNAIREGKINPLSNNPKDFMSEMEFIGKETSKMWMSEFSSIYNSQCYSATANFFHTHSYDELKPNDKNFQIALSAGYTKGGIDFSKFVDLSEIQCKNSTILETDKDIEKGLARKACSIMQEHINVTEPQKFETNLGVIRTDLSFEQQLQLEMVRVFMDRVKEDYNTFLSNHNISSHQLKEKQKKEILTSIINNERMARGYDTHSNKFTEKLLISNITPKKNNKLFNNELESLTTIDGVNIHKELKRYCILDELNSKTNDNTIFIGYSNNNELLKDYDKKSPANREKLKKQYFNAQEDIALRIKEQQRQQLEEQARNEAKRQNTFTNSEDRKATQNQELYYGTPIYDENSTIETREIIDFSKPFLLRQYQSMCVLEKINLQTTKSTTQNQTQETSLSTINYALISQSQNRK